MIVISILTFILFVGGIATSLKIYKTIKCPFGIYTISWNGLFFLYSLNIVDYQQISTEAIYIIFFSYIFFAIGSLSQELPKHFLKRSNNKLKNNHSQSYNNVDSIKRGINVAIFFSVIGGLLWLVQIVSILGVGNLFNHDNAYLFRANIMHQLNPLFSYFIYVFSLGGSILIGLLLSKYNIFKKKYLLIFFGPLIVAFILGQRAFLIISIFCFIAPLLTSNYKITMGVKNKGNKFIIQAISLLVVLFISIGSIRGNFDSDTSTNFFINIVNKIYTYLTGSFVAFSKVLDNWGGELAYGVNTFTPVAKFTNLFGMTNFDSDLIKSIENGREPVFIPYLFNVYSYLWDVISDFGIIGLFIFVWLLGFISSYLWNRCRFRRHITTSDILLTLILVYLLYSFIASITNYSTVWYGFVYALIITMLSRKHKVKNTVI